MFKNVKGKRSTRYCTKVVAIIKVSTTKKMFIMLTEITYYYKLELLWKKLPFEQNVTFLEIFKHYISFAHLFR